MFRKIIIFLKIARGYLSYKLGHPRPFSCTFYPTARCNLECAYCPFARKTGEYGILRKKFEIDTKNAKNHELNTKEAKYIIDQISKEGFAVLSFSGGEVLLRDDLEDLALYAQKKNMLTILHTNAILVTKERAKKLAKVFDNVIVSLAGRAEVNDQLRGEGHFEKTINAVELLRGCSPGIKINLNFLISKFSFQDIDYIVNFARQKFNSVFFMPVEYFPEFFPDRQTTKTIVKKLKEIKEENWNFVVNSPYHLDLFEKIFARENHRIECDAFDLFMAIWVNGDLSGCAMYYYPVGNILNQNIRELRLKGKREREKLFQKCGGCGGTLRISLAFRQPIYESLPAINGFFQKINLIK